MAVRHNNFMAIMSCLSYSLMSNCMVLANRYLVGHQYYGFHQKTFIIFIQAVLAVLILEITKSQGFIQYDSYSYSIARQWAPVTIFFVAMLYTSTQATAGLPIHIVTVFKNITNIAIVAGEYNFFNEKISKLVVLSLFIMLLGAALACYSDVGNNQTESTILGYIWMLLNCICTASYVLYMRYVTSRSTLKLSKYGMAFYNNLISIPFIFPIMILNGEAIGVLSNELLGNLGFIFLLCLSGVMGIMLNLASFWCVSATTATTYATVGALNKIPTTFIGVLLLGEKLQSTTALYVTFGMAGGILYGYAKYIENEEAKKTKMLAAMEAITDDDDVTSKMLNKT